jgi:hypothetical protein
VAEFVLTIRAKIKAPSVGVAETQRLAMSRMLGNPMLKTMLEAAGVELTGYRVEDEIKPLK